MCRLKRLAYFTIRLLWVGFNCLVFKVQLLVFIFQLRQRDFSVTFFIVIVNTFYLFIFVLFLTLYIFTTFRSSYSSEATFI